MTLENEEQLRAIYGLPSGRAKRKVLPALEKHGKNFVDHSPFLVLSTAGKSGLLDASPRGGQPGFVQITPDGDVLIPDFKGNNRIDSLVNIAETGRVATLFIIPGIDETLRVNGRAFITTDPEYLTFFARDRKPPIACIVVKPDEVFLHCAKAFMRSELWNPTKQLDKSDFPTMGQMLNVQLNAPGEPESREDMVKRYKKDL
jgi:PPOX class probable FMN-dependent enzyme